MKNVKKSIIELEDYFVLQDTSVVKLNQNESPYDIPIELKKEILSKLNESQWNRYPQLRPSYLIDAISIYTNYPCSGVVVGNGSNAIIQTVLLTFCEPEDKILVVSPGFPIYPRLAKIIGLEIVDVPLLEDFSFDVATIIEKSEGIRIVILASPNNPTGTALRIEKIEEIAENIEGVLVVDEAYFEFYKKTAQGLLEKFDNIIIIRTFSKAFSLAGLRLGYLLAGPEIAREIEKVRLPCSVGVFQQIAGEVMMKNKDCIKSLADKIIEERGKIFSELKKIPSVNPASSFTNFILFEITGRPAKYAFEAFYKRGVLLRYFETQRLKKYLRVTVGTPEENNIFLKNLKAVLGE